MVEKKKWPVIRIEPAPKNDNYPVARNLRIFMDGKDISDYVREFHISVGVETITTCHIQLMANVEIPEDLAVALVVEGQGEAG